MVSSKRRRSNGISRLRNFRGVLRPTGAVILGIGVAELACAIAGGAVQSFDERAVLFGPDLIGLAVSAIASAALGLGLFFYGAGREHSLTRREAVLAVVVIWLVAGVFGAMPFAIAARMSPIDSFFEAVSGLTTTGATVITDIDGTVPKVEGTGALRSGGLSAPLLLWRSLIQWLGGMGIVVLFVAVFPSVGAGAKHMFKGEVPGTTAEGLRPRIAETSFALWRLYAALTALEAVVLMALGMGPFDAVCHAFTTMSTGGFSTRDASIAGFHSAPIEYVIGTFMLIASVNYGLFYALLRGRSLRSVLRNTELRVFVGLVALLTITLTLGILWNHDNDLLSAFRHAYFMVGTSLSSTGYGTDNYMAYSAPMLSLVVLMMFIGGCSGSTAGGIKVERIVLMAKMSWTQFRKSFRPAVVHLVKMGRNAVPQEILTDVAVFVGVYMASLAFGVFLVVSIDEVSIPTAFGAMLSCLSNMGPAPFHAGGDHFADYSDGAKLVFSMAMLLGRLEFFTIFALLVPDFWRR